VARLTAHVAAQDSATHAVPQRAGRADPLWTSGVRLSHLSHATYLVGMGAMTQVTDRDLIGTVESAVEGDEMAFGRIVSAYHDDLCRVCAYLSGDDQLAEDAVQSAWSIAWRKLGSLREPEHVRPWLMRVAVNETKKLLQKRSRRSHVEVVLDASRLPGGIDPATGVDALDMSAAVARLDPDDRMLLALRYGLGFNATELAAVMGTNPAGTRQRLKRLVDRLRQELE
jgi:RNA polymerase sigma-70 factor (ECF subfamily)